MKEISVAVSLGSGQDLAITKDEHLIIVDYTGYQVDLGRATVRRMIQIQEHIGKLIVHAVPEKDLI